MNTKEVINPADFGMVGVSKDAFFAAIGNRDVNPTIASAARWDRVLGYVSKWQTSGGSVVGITAGGTHLADAVYMLPKAAAGSAS